MAKERPVKLSDFPDDLQKLIRRLPVRTPKVIELSHVTAAISIDINMLMNDDLQRILKDGAKYKPYVSNRNNKLMLLFTINE
jgi:hypothetical protein